MNPSIELTKNMLRYESPRKNFISILIFKTAPVKFQTRRLKRCTYLKISKSHHIPC